MSTRPAPTPEPPAGLGGSRAQQAASVAIAVARAVPVVWIVLAVLIVWISAASPFFLTPEGILAYLKRSAPLAILAIGAYFVLASGEFDLSVGSLVTVVVVVAARLSDGDPANTIPVIAVLFAIGVAVGLFNGFCTTILRVPSFIVTLAMLLMLNGAVFLWTGGAPRGALADNFRTIGREGITGIPVIEEIPYSVIVLVAFAGFALWLAQGGFGRRVLAVGDNDRAAALSGISVTRVRIAAFVLSATSAVIAGILLGGFAGVTSQVGQGLEFQAITAAVLGGTVLGGGRGSVTGAIGGALVLQALFMLLNLYDVDNAVEQTVTGLLIIAAVALAAFRTREA
ncbi:MAG TPA: ABC transporter permease [Solirubrobacterales bacterium]|nr:ABC transporter permease [Solirubrobacterales bacterium]